MTPATKALDGGWGWAIVVASFMAQFLAYGSPQSVGVLYPEWLHTFKEGKGMTAWVGSLVAGVGLIASEYNTNETSRISFSVAALMFVFIKLERIFCHQYFLWMFVSADISIRDLLYICTITMIIILTVIALSNRDSPTFTHCPSSFMNYHHIMSPITRQMQ